MASTMIRVGERAIASVPASWRRARCSTTTVPSGARPMRCLLGMSPISGTEHCTAMLWLPTSPLAGCSLKFSGFDLDLIGFEPDRLDDILAGLGSSGLSDPDSTPE